MEVIMKILKTRTMVSMCMLFILASFTMARADVVYPDNPIAGCVGFDGWWRSLEATIGAKEMIYFVIGELVALGYNDAEILDISAGLWPLLPL
jgi:hypothetical protein